jgi:hypothetical protein
MREHSPLRINYEKDCQAKSSLKLFIARFSRRRLQLLLLEDEPGATNVNVQKIIAQMATTNSTAEQQNYNSSSRTKQTFCFSASICLRSSLI